MFRTIRHIFHLLIILLSCGLVNSCANMASPTGGAYDDDPPKLIRSNPKNGALNVTRKVIEIEFDENIKIEKPAEKVIITPPQIDLPVIKAVGKKAVVEINDDLLDNATYTIDFTDAIVDNNEGNPLENFSISFSTGDVLDTLAVSGIVLSADNLEPQQGIYVGIHTNLEDTAFTNLPFERISRTDSRGKFTVKGLAPGEYNIFALNDNNRDYKYDNPQESIAFLDSIIVPSSMPAVRQDTVFKDSVTIESIESVNYTRFIPDDIVLRSFESKFKRKYIQKHERPVREKLLLFFGAPQHKPSFELLDSTRTYSDDWYLMERSLENDTLTFWITDSLVFNQDTLNLKVDYMKTDSLNMDQLQTDTLRFTYRAPRQTKKEKDKDTEGEEPPIEFLDFSHNIKTVHEVFDPIYWMFEKPVLRFDSSNIVLEKEVDSLFTPLTFKFAADSLNPRKFKIEHKWEFDNTYRLSIDSASVHGVYGLWNKKVEQKFKIKSMDQYGNLMFNITGLPESKTAYVELLDSSDKPFRKIKVKNGEALFFDINPGKIYARLFIDENEDGEWTTGNYEKKRQPERVYYYPREYEIRAYTDHEESWNLLELPLDEQKPRDILKNKPEEKKKRNANREREAQRSQSSSRGSSSSRQPSTTSRSSGGMMQR
mgnify:CR=1 FL=1